MSLHDEGGKETVIDKIKNDIVRNRKNTKAGSETKSIEVV